MTEIAEELRARIELVETGYEFMLAYAAQGRDREEEGSSGPSIRAQIRSLHESLNVLSDLFEVEIKRTPATSRPTLLAFNQILSEEAHRATAAVAVVLVLKNISSQVVDNLNASTYLRSILTGMFLMDEAISNALLPTAN